MFRSRLRLFLLSLAALSLAVVVTPRLFPDLSYGVGEFFLSERYHRYDSLITEIAQRHQIDPMLVKAVIWRESKFRPNMEGTSGERGLMQVGESAATEWARAEKIATFVPTDLVDPKTNIEAGTWYLAQALRRWKDKDDPIPFALAEYNAGRRNVKRWIDEARARKLERERLKPGSTDAQVSGGELEESIDFPSVRNYVAAIRRRMEYYKLRGQL